MIDHVTASTRCHERHAARVTFAFLVRKFFEFPAEPITKAPHDRYMHRCVQICARKRMMRLRAFQPEARAYHGEKELPIVRLQRDHPIVRSDAAKIIGVDKIPTVVLSLDRRCTASGSCVRKRQNSPRVYLFLVSEQALTACRGSSQDAPRQRTRGPSRRNPAANRPKKAIARAAIVIGAAFAFAIIIASTPAAEPCAPSCGPSSPSSSRSPPLVRLPPPPLVLLSIRCIRRRPCD